MTAEILIQVEGERFDPEQLAEEIEALLSDDATLSKVYVDVSDVSKQDDEIEEEES